MSSIARLGLAFLTLALLAPAAAGCAADPAEEGEASEDELKKGPNSDRWVYNGVLPHLEEPSIVVSQSAHTARVTGFLPASYDSSKLPFYADPVEEAGRTKIAVVYPIATGSSVNHQPDDYVTERVYPRRTETSAPWGGFPFISYVNDVSPFKGIAFHGPITAEDGEWKLIRGPVSHGCNRMMGEHAVELAHLIGVDMTTKIWSGDTILRSFKVPVKVIRKTPDSWQGQNVDVDYPSQKSVARPTENVKMFKAWSADDFPSWVCKVDPKSVPSVSDLPSDYCSSVAKLTNRADPKTGPR